MIFVSLGSQKFQFNRLLRCLDELIEQGFITDTVFAQIGASDYEPKHFEYVRFLERDGFRQRLESCSLLITHGGTGTIITAVKLGKKVIAVPRLAKYGEHVDDHQIQLIAQFTEQNLICGIEDCTQIKDALSYVQNHTFDRYQSQTQAIADSIAAFISAL